jgi:hypothetical protein
MAPLPYSSAARVRDVLSPAKPDEKAPRDVHDLVREIAAGTVFEPWFAKEKLSVRELAVVCGQVAAARPGAGLAEAFANLADDCRSAEDSLCPDNIVWFYEVLAARVPEHGPCPHLRKHLRSRDWFLPGLQAVSARAAAAAGLVDLSG